MQRQVRLVALLAALAGCAQKPAGASAVASAVDAGSDADHWSASLQPTADGVTVAIAARTDFHLNPDYPVAFTPDEATTPNLLPRRVELLAALVRHSCAAHPEESCAATAPLPVGSPRPEHARVSGVLAFSVCNPQRCLIPKEHLALEW